MSARPPQSLSPYLLLDLIGRSDLNPGEKNVARVLVRWADGQTGLCWPAVATVALHAGMSVRGVQRILRRLRRKGVVVVEGASRGGRGKTNRIRLEVSALQRLCGGPTNPDPESGFCPNPSTPKPRPRIPETPTRDPSNPDPGSGELPVTTNEPPPPPIGGGGGQGLAPAEPPDDHSVGYQALIDFGVAATNARQLARRFPLGVIEAGIEWVQQCGGDPESPAAILVGALRDGTAAAALERRRRRVAAAEKADLRQRRAGRFKELRLCTMQTDAGKARPAWARIDQVWRSDESLADAEILDDGQLLGNGANAWDLLDRLSVVADAMLARADGFPRAETT